MAAPARQYCNVFPVAIIYILVYVTILKYSFAVGLQCEELQVEDCAFAVSSSGARCVLETNVAKDGSVELECQTSQVVTSEERWRGRKESAECVEWCGLDRKWIGLSSDFLSEHEWHKRICEPSCYLNCPNIVDFFSSVADAEGVGLIPLCEVDWKRLHRKMIETPQEEVQTALPMAPSTM
ncbi:hypothetical protein KP509_38G064900 [Ceratopteris richardii]|uniref:PAR1 protein n=1 Tax=Ceratopteris richardii TaxID=49495 RepID=A0A8T2Q5E0_CERRI|nr:hypothetical protein KP509_38G064900 [Ceratopteris richardii]